MSEAGNCIVGFRIFDLAANYIEELILPSQLASSIHAPYLFRCDLYLSTNYSHHTPHDRSGEAVEVQEELDGEIRGVPESFALH